MVIHASWELESANILIWLWPTQDNAKLRKIVIKAVLGKLIYNVELMERHMVIHAPWELRSAKILIWLWPTQENAKLRMVGGRWRREATDVLDLAKNTTKADTEIDTANGTENNTTNGTENTAKCWECMPGMWG